MSASTGLITLELSVRTRLMVHGAASWAGVGFDRRQDTVHQKSRLKNNFLASPDLHCLPTGCPTAMLRIPVVGRD